MIFTRWTAREELVYGRRRSDGGGAHSWGLGPIFEKTKYALGKDGGLDGPASGMTVLHHPDHTVILSRKGDLICTLQSGNHSLSTIAYPGAGVVTPPKCGAYLVALGELWWSFVGKNVFIGEKQLFGNQSRDIRLTTESFPSSYSQVLPRLLVGYSSKPPQAGKHVSYFPRDHSPIGIESDPTNSFGVLDLAITVLNVRFKIAAGGIPIPIPVH